MFWYVGLVLIVTVQHSTVNAAPPVRLTIDCSSSERGHLPFDSSIPRSKATNNPQSFNVDSFCRLIHNAIPKSVKDGKFIILDRDDDMSAHSDTQAPIIIAPPKDFKPRLGLPKIKVPKLRIPNFNIPTLKPRKGLKAPRLGSTMSIPSLREEQSSAERMERFKKGVQKMLHLVKVLGQIDQYLSDRTRIVIDKLAKTFAE